MFFDTKQIEDWRDGSLLEAIPWLRLKMIADCKVMQTVIPCHAFYGISLHFYALSRLLCAFGQQLPRRLGPHEVQERQQRQHSLSRPKMLKRWSVCPMWLLVSPRMCCHASPWGLRSKKALEFNSKRVFFISGLLNHQGFPHLSICCLRIKDWDRVSAC